MIDTLNVQIKSDIRGAFGEGHIGAERLFRDNKLEEAN
jgi:hypothetical protein